MVSTPTPSCAGVVTSCPWLTRTVASVAGRRPSIFELRELRRQRRAREADPDRQRRGPEQTLDAGDGDVERRAVAAVCERVGQHAVRIDDAAHLGVADDIRRLARHQLDLAVLERAERRLDRRSCFGLGHAADRHAADDHAGQHPAAVRLCEGDQPAQRECDSEQRDERDAADDAPRAALQDARCRRDGLCGGHSVDHPERTSG